MPELFIQPLCCIFVGLNRKPENAVSVSKRFFLKIVPTMGTDIFSDREENPVAQIRKTDSEVFGNFGDGSSGRVSVFVAN